MQGALDTVLRIPAPEFIVFRHTVAGPLSRALAVLLDHLIIFALMIVLYIVLGLLLGFSAIAGLGDLSGFFLMLLFLGLFFLYWSYFFVFEWRNRGRTPGKMALGLRVVSVDGTALEVAQILLRNLLRVADMMPGLGWLPSYAIALVSCFATAPAFQRLGDLAAGTIVIAEERDHSPGVDVEQEPHVQVLAADMQLRTFPAPSLTQGLNDFVGRRRSLHPARAHEIAAGLEGGIRRVFGLKGHADADPVDLLLAAHYHLYSLTRRDAARLERPELNDTRTLHSKT